MSGSKNHIRWLEIVKVLIGRLNEIHATIYIHDFDTVVIGACYSSQRYHVLFAQLIRYIMLFVVNYFGCNSHSALWSDEKEETKNVVCCQLLFGLVPLRFLLRFIGSCSY